MVAANVPKEKLDAEDDYYARAAEFRTWLRDAKDLYLDDIAADEARKLFAQFAERWNAGPPRRELLQRRGGRPRRQAHAPRVVVQALRHGGARVGVDARGREPPVGAGRPDADPPIRQTTRGRGEAVPATSEASGRRRRAAASEGAAAAAGRVSKSVFVKC